MFRCILACFSIVIFVPTPSVLASEQPFISEIGVRLGEGQNRGESLSRFELTFVGRTHKEWSIGPHLGIAYSFDGALGFFGHDGNQEQFVRLGSRLTFDWDDWPVHFILSSGPALLAESKFGDLNLGSNLQFISGAGFDWEVSDHWTLSYRWEHISNSSIVDTNPGLNFNLIGFSYRF